VKLATLKEAVVRNVEPGSIVSTDELMSYALLERSGYKHGVVTHSAKEWSYYDYRHDATHHTNTVEGFWRLFDEERDVRSSDWIGVVEPA
jgi:transposase